MVDQENHQRNWPLIAGVAFPVVFLAAFFFYTGVARGVVDPPGFDLLYAVHERGSETNTHLTFRVAGERIITTAAYHDQTLGTTLVLYRVRASDLVARPVELSLPQAETTDEPAKPIEVDVPELAGIRVSSSYEAPDGYTFRSARNRGPGLITAIFFHGSRRHLRLEKLGIAKRIETPGDDAIHAYPTFLGWVISE